MLVCDFLMIVSHQDTSDDGTLGLLEYFPSENLQSKMLLFVRDHIFTEEEDEDKGQQYFPIGK